MFLGYSVTICLITGRVQDLSPLVLLSMESEEMMGLVLEDPAHPQPQSPCHSQDLLPGTGATTAS